MPGDDDDDFFSEESSGDMSLLKENIQSEEEKQVDEAPPADEFPVEEPQEEKLSRKEKKRARYDQMMQSLEETRRENAELKGRVDEMGRRPDPAPVKEEEDPLRAEVDRIHQQKKAVWSEFNARSANKTLTAERQGELEADLRRLEEEQVDARVEHKLRGRLPRQQDERVTVLNARYPDVMSHDKAAGWASSRYQQRVLEGAKEGWDLIDEVAGEARRQFKMTSSDPTDGQRRAHTGAPRGRTAPRGNEASKHVTMTPELKKLADATYPNIMDDKARWARWAKDIGPDFLKAEKD